MSSQRAYRPAVVLDNYAKIPLGVEAKRGYALVDLEDAGLDVHKWSVSDGYASANIDGKTNVRMHRYLMNPPKGFEVDHVNMNRLDNRRSNLRICSSAENRQNTGKRPSNTTGYKGVGWKKETAKYVARIQKDGKLYHIGYFTNTIEAARAYNKKALELHGEFARINCGV